MLTISEDGLVLERCDKTASGRVIVPEGIIKINSFAFQNCEFIEEIILPDGLSLIGYDAFASCYSLRKINIPSSVKKISSSAFQRCINLLEINCHSQITEIDSYAFQGCSNLTIFPFTDSIKEIGYKAFDSCIVLQKVYFSRSLDRISSGAFSNCESLSEIFFPENILNIGDSAFANCTSLGKITIANTKVTISSTSFIGCNHLINLYLREMNPNLVLASFASCYSLNRIFIYAGSSTSEIRNVFKREAVQQEHDNELKYHSLYYRMMGMNITQMKWNSILQNINPFKQPIDSNWRIYKNQEQSVSHTLGLDWTNSTGIGVILGYNNYRALDIDNCNSFYLKVLYQDRGLDGLIDDFLKILGLPTDYPWVVKSGSGEGFHVIFRCEDTPATTGIDSISFQPNDKHGDSQCRIFERIELRWSDHLVLPPSIHSLSGKYLFRNNTLPNKVPETINLRSVDHLLYKYCGNRTISDATSNGIGFEYTEVCKVISRHDSYLSPHNYRIDSPEWLEYMDSDEAKNSLALKYLFGTDVEADGAYAVNLLESCSCQSAIYNLLQLYACGYVKAGYEKYEQLLKKLDTNLFSGHLNILYENARIYIPKPELYLFFDTETTGLPKNYDAPSSDVDNWPRIIQLSWMITDKDHNVITRHNLYIKPNGFVIPQDSIKIHGITTKYALDNGVDIVDALEMLHDDLKKVKYVVGHNVSFDEKIVEAECLRVNYDVTVFTDKFHQESLCTMKSTTDFCKIPARFYRGYKYPTLQELHRKLFGYDFKGAHDAFSDITATMKCFWELKKRGWSNDDFRLDFEDDDLPW